MRLKTGTAAILLAVSVFGCRSAPVPAEAAEADRQEQTLKDARAAEFREAGFAAYAEALRLARKAVEAESLKLGWFRDYDRARRDYGAVLERGRRLLAEVESAKAELRAAHTARLDALRKKAAGLHEATLSIGERGPARQRLARAGILLDEARVLVAGDRYGPSGAGEKLDQAEALLGKSEDAALAVVERFLDPGAAAEWRRQVEQTVALSRSKRIAAIVVSKLERTLTVYQDGVSKFHCPVGLGFSGLSRKTMSGDYATPEGQYKVTRKFPNTQYYKALLIDYPNDRDRRRFAEAVRRGEVPAGTAIGGSIEIHGGGKDILTRGCVSVDNADMDVIYRLIPVGTPVTIVGTLSESGQIIERIKGGKS